MLPPLPEAQLHTTLVWSGTNTTLKKKKKFIMEVFKHHQSSVRTGIIHISIMWMKQEGFPTFALSLFRFFLFYSKSQLACHFTPVDISVVCKKYGPRPT